jgi:hypothetical protein
MFNVTSTAKDYGYGIMISGRDETWYQMLFQPKTEVWFLRGEKLQLFANQDSVNKEKYCTIYTVLQLGPEKRTPNKGFHYIWKHQIRISL